ncbi:putative tetrahydrocannabinolic acid synthase [Helianthus anomalus]
MSNSMSSSLTGFSSALSAVTGFWSHTYQRTAYLDYIDLDLGVGKDTYEEASVWGESYWKRENFKKLIRIKAQVDPENFFRHPQSIPYRFSTIHLFRPAEDMYKAYNIICGSSLRTFFC